MVVTTLIVDFDDGAVGALFFGRGLAALHLPRLLGVYGSNDFPFLQDHGADCMVGSCLAH